MPQSRVVAMLVGVLVLVASSANLGVPQARANTGVDLAAELADPALSQAGAQDLVADNPGEPWTLSDYDQCPPPNASQPPNFPNQTYRTIDLGQNEHIDLKLDEYDPPINAGPAPYTVMVLVHGGGYWRSCRFHTQQVAWEAAGHDLTLGLSHSYVVLNIDYRLACDPSDQNLTGSPIVPLCGWPYPRQDPGASNRIGPAIHDVQDAVRWVSTEWQDLPNRPLWNGRIVILGGSAGGGLSFSAVAPSPAVGGGVTVDALAAWSGPLRLDQMSNLTYPCDPGQSAQPGQCALGESHFYLGCSSQTYPDNNCIQQGRYVDASPRTWYTSASLPHAFFANGGGPNGSTPELIAWQSADDFRFRLVGLGWQQGNQFDFCTVNLPEHGTGLRFDYCNAGAGTVWQRTADFLG